MTCTTAPHTWESLFFVVQNKVMNQTKGFRKQKAMPCAHSRGELQEEAKELKEVNLCVKEWPDGEMMSVLPGQAQGLILVPCLQAACPSKLSPVLSTERMSQWLFKESLLFLLRKVAFVFLKGY